MRKTLRRVHGVQIRSKTSTAESTTFEGRIFGELWVERLRERTARQKKLEEAKAKQEAELKAQELEREQQKRVEPVSRKSYEMDVSTLDTWMRFILNDMQREQERTMDEAKQRAKMEVIIEAKEHLGDVKIINADTWEDYDGKIIVKNERYAVQQTKERAVCHELRNNPSLKSFSVGGQCGDFL